MLGVRRGRRARRHPLRVEDRGGRIRPAARVPGLGEDRRHGRICGAAALHLYVGAQRDVSGAPGLQGDGVGVEVSQHVRHGVKPQVVDVALPVLVYR